MPGPDGKILTELKAPLGLLEANTPFDLELLLHINSIVANLNQLGVGPSESFEVTPDTTWSQLLVDDPNKQLANVKSYMYLRLKMLFDSGSMPSHLVAAYEKMIEEQEWRIVIAADPMLPWVTEDPEAQSI